MPSHEITKKIIIVTPAFPGGADNKPPVGGPFDIDRDGVRPSSIVYGMRWWFRALAGGVRGTQDLDSIRKAESAIFGTANPIELGGKSFEGGLSSRVGVAITRNVEERHIKPFKPQEAFSKYLAYGLFPTNPNQENFSRRYIEPGAKFEFSLRTSPRRVTEEPEINPELIEALSGLWVELGGLGGRWRHGLGGMRGLDSPDIVKPGDYPAQLRQRIASARTLVEEFLDSPSLALRPAPTPREKTPSFPVCFDPWFKLAWRAPAGADAMGALKIAQEIWHGTRQVQRGGKQSSSRNAALYQDVRKKIKKADTKAKFAGLGMPIPYGFPKDDKSYHGAVAPLESSRRASPIWFRVIAVNPKQCGILAIYWDSTFLPASESRQVRVGVKDRDEQQVGYNAHEAAEWFEKLIKNPQDRFVRA